MTPPSTRTPKDASASISEALAGVFGTGSGEGRGPLCGPPDERAQRAVGAVAQLGEGVGGIRMLLDEGGVEQLGQPLPQHAGGHVVAALLQRTEPDRPVSQFPDDPQVPPAAEQVEGGHQWPAGARPSDRPILRLRYPTHYRVPYRFVFRSASGLREAITTGLCDRPDIKVVVPVWR